MDASTATIINDALQEPAPFMGEPPTLDVDLFLGVPTGEGGDLKWHNHAVLRELNGSDEEYLATVERREDVTYGEYLNEILARGTVSIGDVAVNGDVRIIDQLSIFDRDLLFLALVRATYGDNREIRTLCGNCGKSNDVVIELDKDFPTKKPDFNLQDGLQVKTSKGIVRLRFPRGEDTKVIQNADKTDAEVNTEMLARCVVWDSAVTYEDSLKWARSVGISDRRKLTDALLAIDFGPRMGEVKTQCAECSKDMPILLDWVSLLLG